MMQFVWVRRWKRRVRIFMRRVKQKRRRRRIQKENLQNEKQQKRIRMLGKKEYERKLVRQRIKRCLLRVGAVILGLGAVAVSVGGALGFLHLNRREYVVTNGVETRSVSLIGGSAAEACQRAGMNGEVVLEEESDGVTYVTVAPTLSISVHYGNQTIILKSTADTVENILVRAGIRPGTEDIITPARGKWIDTDSNIDVIRVTRQTEIEKIQLPFQVEQHETDALYKGQERVIQYGSYGSKELTYEVVRYDGKEHERKLLKELVTKEPTDCILEVGTAEPPEEPEESEDTTSAEGDITSQSDNDRPLPAELQTPDNAYGRSDSSSSDRASDSSNSQTSSANTTNDRFHNFGNTGESGSADNNSQSNSASSNGSNSSTESDESDSDDSTSTSELSTAGRRRVWSVPCSVKDDTIAHTLTTADGVVLPYTSVIKVKATAYHRVEDGGLTTAMGTTTDYGTVAVDPRVIPLDSKVYIVSDGGISWSYGPGLAEDTGGAIKGARIDLFFMTGDEANDFGVRDAKIYLLE